MNVHTRMYTYVCLFCISGGDDYQSGPFSFIVPAGDINVSIDHNIIFDDFIFEGNELLSLTIDSFLLPSRVFVQPGCMLAVTIVDNDREC